MKIILITEIQANRGAIFYILLARGTVRTPVPPSVTPLVTGSHLYDPDRPIPITTNP